jgi:thiol-disulfide isomerase/thioredoxin
MLVLAAGLAATPGQAFGRREKPAPAPVTQAQPATEAASPDANASSERGLTDTMQDLGFQLPSRAVQAVDFDLADLAGDSHALQRYRGSVVFLNFWATWCGPCRTEMPDLQHLHDDLGDEAQFAMLAINLQEDAVQVRRFASELGLSFQILLDSSGETSAAYGARTLPMSYVIDKDGSILARAIGIRSWDDPAYTRLFAALAGRER